MIAFVCHHNSFLIFGSLKQPSLNRFATVTHWSMGIAFFTCFALAVSGYLVFTDKTVGKYKENIVKTKYWKLLYILTQATSWIISHPITHSSILPD